ncbi:hypothetical protein ACFXO2_12035 [Streptomyces sp. NPDC059152]|uniref:hypothetical protein n=1 Tax=Streptomyces sp. NPDC059152 TaxID=3346742 RepID=UPI00367BC047
MGGMASGPGRVVPRVDRTVPFEAVDTALDGVSLPVDRLAAGRRAATGGAAVEEIPDQAAALTTGGGAGDGSEPDASTTVLSDADTAAPAPAATALAGTSKAVQADGLLLRTVERQPPGPGELAGPGPATLTPLDLFAADDSAIGASTGGRFRGDPDPRRPVGRPATSASPRCGSGRRGELAAGRLFTAPAGEQDPAETDCEISASSEKQNQLLAWDL